MNKSKFFEKVGKLTFSFVLTGFLVTGVVIAIAETTWQTYTTWDPISAIEWRKMVTEIQWKFNKTDIPSCNAWEFLTAWPNNSLVCGWALSSSDILATVMDKCEVCIWHADSNFTPNATTCSSFGETARKKLSWDVDDNDTIAIKVVCKGGTWSSTETTSTDTNCSYPKWWTKKSGICNVGEKNSYVKDWWTPCGYESWGSYGWWMWPPMFENQVTATQTCK